MVKIKVGDTVETVHGQKVKVLAVEERGAKFKKGVEVQPGETWYLTEQPGDNCWFPASKIEGAK